MKVLHVLNSLKRGGAENLVINLAHETVKFGHDVRIVTLTDDIEYDNLIQRYGIEVATCGFQGTIYSIKRLLQARKRLQEIVEHFNPDIIHTHIFLSDVIVRFSYIGSAKVVTTLHRPEPWWTRGGLKPLLKKWTEGLSARRVVSHFIAVSDETRSAAINNLGISPSRIDVVMNGVDTKMFAPVHSLPSSTDSRFVILHLARFYPEKAHDVLLKSFGLLLRQSPDAELWLIGDGPLRSEIEVLAGDLGIKENVKFLGLRSDIPGLLSQADVFTLPSIREGLPIALLEAMSSALPVVVTPAGEMPNVVKHGINGLIVDFGDIQGFAAQFLRLGHDKSLRGHLGNAARKTVEKDYSIQQVALKYLDVYTKVLSCERFFG